MLILQIEVQFYALPFMCCYFFLTVMEIARNSKRKQQNLENPEIKEVIQEGRGLHEQIDKFIYDRIALTQKNLGGNMNASISNSPLWSNKVSVLNTDNSTMLNEITIKDRSIYLLRNLRNQNEELSMKRASISGKFQSSL